MLVRAFFALRGISPHGLIRPIRRTRARHRPGALRDPGHNSFSDASTAHGAVLSDRLRDMARLLVYYAHPGHKHSHVNRYMARQAAELDGITYVDLYRDYPRFDINVNVEQAMQGNSAAFGSRLDRGWVPPTLEDVEAEQQAAADSDDAGPDR
jgi:hypothetical protein